MRNVTERRFVEQLGEHEELDQVFLVRERQLRPNRNGNLYLQLRLADRTGTVVGMMWNADDGVLDLLGDGPYARVRGTTQIYNGALQILVKQIQHIGAGEVQEDDFLILSPRDIEAYEHRLIQHLRGIQHEELRQLAECFLSDEDFLATFCQAPAAMRNHHAYEGGLLEHVVQLIDLAVSVCQHYPDLHQDLLVMGVFLHDVGKIEELRWDPDAGYTDVGQLVGHPVLGIRILDRALQRFETAHGRPCSTFIVTQLQHLIVSHHGRLEFGSPKVPMTLEALALSYLDDLDAKLHQFRSLMQSDTGTDGNWTTYHPQLGRKLFKTRPTDRSK